MEILSCDLRIVHCVSPLMMPLKYQCSDITFYDVVHKTGGVVAKVDGSCQQSDAGETGSKLSLATRSFHDNDDITFATTSNRSSKLFFRQGKGGRCCVSL